MTATPTDRDRAEAAVMFSDLDARWREYHITDDEIIDYIATALAIARRDANAAWIECAPIDHAYRPPCRRWNIGALNVLLDAAIRQSGQEES